MDQFGVSVNQASTDLNRHIGFAPDNMVYDKSARTYARGPEFMLEVGPHFTLSQTQAKAIALLSYALRRPGLDTDPNARLPRNRQIVLVNRDEIIIGIHFGDTGRTTA